jgi:hypothetical protein
VCGFYLQKYFFIFCNAKNDYIFVLPKLKKLTNMKKYFTLALIITCLLASCTPTPKGTKVTASQYGEAWGFPFQEGYVYCVDNFFVVIEDNEGKIYALNGSARGQREARGWRDIQDLMPKFDLSNPSSPDYEANFKKQSTYGDTYQKLIDLGNKDCKQQQDKQ